MAKSVEQIPGVVSTDVNFATGVMLLEYDAAADPRARALAVVRSAGHRVDPLSDSAGVRGVPSTPETSWWDDHLHDVTTVFAGVLIVAGWLLGRLQLEGAHAGSVAAFSAAIVTGGWLIFRRALVSLRSRTLDMNVLMTVAVLGAAAIGVYDLTKLSHSDNAVFIPGYIGAFVVSLIATYFAIWLFFKLIKNRNLKYFGYYCLAASLVVMALVVAGVF